MSLDNSSLLIGAVVGIGAAIALTGKKGGSGKSTRKGKGLGATYVVSGTSRKVSGARATAARKAAGTTTKRKKTSTTTKSKAAGTKRKTTTKRKK